MLNAKDLFWAPLSLLASSIISSLLIRLSVLADSASLSDSMPVNDGACVRIVARVLVWIRKCCFITAWVLSKFWLQLSVTKEDSGLCSLWCSGWISWGCGSFDRDKSGVCVQTTFLIAKCAFRWYQFHVNE